MNGDGTYGVHYSDGDKRDSVAEDRIFNSDGSKRVPQLNVGDGVIAFWKGTVDSMYQEQYPGTVTAVHADGSYQVTFHDGSSNNKVIFLSYEISNNQYNQGRITLWASS